MTEIIATQNLGHNYGLVTALAEVSVTFPAGGIHAIVGENGSGKSTLFAIIAGLLHPTHGRVTIHPETSKVGLVRQFGALMPELSVLDNFALAKPGLGNINRDQFATTVATALAKLPVIPEDIVANLSPGLRTQVEVARLLFFGSKIILLDEPTAQLSSTQTAELFSQLRSSVAAGATVVFSSHRLAEVLEYADTVHVLRNGSVTLTAPTASLEQRQLHQAMFTEVPPANKFPSPPVTTTPALELHNLGCGLGEINLAVHAGEIVGITAELGQGQEQLINTIAGFQSASSGQVLIAGKPREHQTNLKWGLSCLPSDAMATTGIASMTVTENLLLHKFRQAQFMCWRLLRNLAASLKYATNLVGHHGLAQVTTQYPLAVLSGGNQRKMLLARELDLPAHAVVLHNAAAGLDAQAVTKLIQQLHDLASHGAGVLVIGEDSNFIAQVATRTFVLKRGHLKPQES